MSGLSRGVLNVVKSRTGKTISEQTIGRLASRVTANTMQSDKQLRSLILEVAKAANVKVPEAAVQNIIRTIKQSGGVGALEQMISAMMKK